MNSSRTIILLCTLLCFASFATIAATWKSFDVIERLRKCGATCFRKSEGECGCAEAEEREADERKTWVELILK